jgi:hypothetical protein
MDVRALATDLFEKHQTEFDVPLIIDQLGVTLHLNMSQNYSMWIISDDVDELLYEIESPEVIRTLEDTIAAIEKTRTILEKLYYCKPLGKFISTEDTIELLKHKVFKKFKKIDDCSVCLEETCVHTKCNHYCCHKCMEKVKTCPICRRDLYE